jgi:5'-3' exonuclease
MGIPSYFSHIIRNYSNIIRNLNGLTPQYTLHHLYMDCNSVIYDAVHSINKQPEQKLNNDEFEEAILDNVVSSITYYITFIKPTKSIYIAFDGVAPFAKMDQQRTRRYKTQFMNTVFGSSSTWNTSAITPGTKFMNKLNNRLNIEFNNTELKYNVDTITVSGSNVPGEGEHKLFENIRNNPNTSQNMAVYGLDADLIMLSLFHLKYCNNIFVFREAPEFFKNSLPISVDSNEPHFLDIRLLSSSIISNMDCKFPDFQRIYDYVFLCLFLGNDFMPHFPAMNIRTHGIQTLLDIYKNCIGNKQNRFLISNGQIQWQPLSKLLNEVEKNEQTYILNEYKTRSKFDKWYFANETVKEKEEYIQNIPIIFRADEKYICPTEPMWETRYYKSLFGIVPDDKNVATICQNYFEGLEWVFKYYSGQCSDWKWKYNYHYPPLFSDLFKYTPSLKFKGFFNKNSIPRPLSPYIQLSYVLPVQAHHLLPTNVSIHLNKYYSHLYPINYDFKWAFCRYFWESHPILPDIPMGTLERWNKQFEIHINKST